MSRFKAEFPKVCVTVYLGAPDDERRDRFIPVNRRYPLKALMETCRELSLQPRERIPAAACPRRLLSGGGIIGGPAWFWLSFPPARE